MINWDSVFDDIQISKGASEDEIIELINQFNLPLTQQEVAEIKTNLLKMKIDVEMFNPAKWFLPDKPFPKSFLNFLTWNNGGWCRTGDREFGFLATFDLREYTLAYMFPEWMNGAVPFALNGGGVFHVFDMREEAKNGEYPILITESGNQGYHDAKIIGNSFLEACEGKINVEELL